MAKSLNSEISIQATICEYLALKMRQGKLMMWRQNSGGIFSDGHYRKLPKHAMTGIPDIIVIRDGFFIGLEVKQAKGRQSDNQKDFETLCKKNGAEYYVVHSLEDVIEIGL